MRAERPEASTIMSTRHRMMTEEGCEECDGEVERRTSPHAATDTKARTVMTPFKIASADEDGIRRDR